MPKKNVNVAIKLAPFSSAIFIKNYFFRAFLVHHLFDFCQINKMFLGNVHL